MPVRRARNTISRLSRRRRARLDANGGRARRANARDADANARRATRAGRDATRERRGRASDDRTRQHPSNTAARRWRAGERAPLLARGEDVERGLRDDDAANGAADASKGRERGTRGTGKDVDDGAGAGRMRGARERRGVRDDGGFGVEGDDDGERCELGGAIRGDSGADGGETTTGARAGES